MHNNSGLQVHVHTHVHKPTGIHSHTHIHNTELKDKKSSLRPACWGCGYDIVFMLSFVVDCRCLAQGVSLVGDVALIELVWSTWRQCVTVVWALRLWCSDSAQCRRKPPSSLPPNESLLLAAYGSRCRILNYSSINSACMMPGMQNWCHASHHGDNW